MKKKLFELSVKPFMMYDNFKNKLKDEEGAVATEYALVLGFIVVAILGASALMFPDLKLFFQDVAKKIKAMV